MLPLLIVNTIPNRQLWYFEPFPAFLCLFQDQLFLRRTLCQPFRLQSDPWSGRTKKFEVLSFEQPWSGSALWYFQPRCPSQLKLIYWLCWNFGHTMTFTPSKDKVIWGNMVKTVPALNSKLWAGFIPWRFNHTSEMESNCQPSANECVRPHVAAGARSWRILKKQPVALQCCVRP